MQAWAADADCGIDTISATLNATAVAIDEIFLRKYIVSPNIGWMRLFNFSMSRVDLASTGSLSVEIIRISFDTMAIYEQ